MLHNAATLTTERINLGVSQGSTLGLSLFIFCIKDIFKFGNKAIFIVYADDMSVFFTGANLDNTVTTTNIILLSLNTGIFKN